VNHLKAHRNRAGLTQPQLAKKAGVAARTVFSAEKGRPTRQDTKRRLLKALGMEWGQRSEVWP